jgi:CRISPR type III-A-associated protein Csm2
MNNRPPHRGDQRGGGDRYRESKEAKTKRLIQEFKNDFDRKYGDAIKNFGQVDGKTLIAMAEFVGFRLVRDPIDRAGNCKEGLDLKMNQIRRFLDALRRIENEMESPKWQKLGENDPNWKEIEYKLTLLTPKLAYAAGRVDEAKPLMKVLEPAIMATAKNPGKYFPQLLDFMEAIVAYHCFYGGKNS